MTYKLDTVFKNNQILLRGVGALTSKPYAFVARPWELKNTETIDILDSWGSWIRVDSRGSDVLRILPRFNKEINDEWISDKTRFGYEGLKRQRLVQPYYQSLKNVDSNLNRLLNKERNNYISVSWKYMLNVLTLNLLSNKQYNQKFNVFAGPLVNLETMVGLKTFAHNTLGTSNLSLDNDNLSSFSDSRESLLFHDLLGDIEKMNLCLFVGTNIRFEAPILLARLRRHAKRTVRLADVSINKVQSCRISKSTLIRSLIIANFGLVYNFRIPFYNLGGMSSLVSFLEGKHFFCRIFSKFKSKTVITSSNLLRRQDSLSLYNGLNVLKQVCFNNQFAVNMIHSGASHYGAIELGFGNTKFNKSNDFIKNRLNSCFYFVGGVPSDFNKSLSSVLIYQGHNMSSTSTSFDFILPGISVWESFSQYMNTEGRLNKSLFISFPIKSSKIDYSVFEALTLYMRYYGDKVNSLNLVYKIKERLSLVGNIRESRHMTGLVSHPNNVNKIFNYPFVSKILNFYQTDSITNVSRVMTSCTQAFSKNFNAFW